VEILYTCVYKWKTETCEAISEMWGGRIKENDGGGEFSYDKL
jgi:hypothetical protein